MESQVEQAIERMRAPTRKLVIGFEHLVDILRQISVSCFEHQGLTKPSLAQVALSGLTAGPLLAAFESTNLTGSQAHILAEIVRRNRPLIQNRNIVLHGRVALD